MQENSKADQGESYMHQKKKWYRSPVATFLTIPDPSLLFRIRQGRMPSPHTKHCHGPILSPPRRHALALFDHSTPQTLGRSWTRASIAASTATAQLWPQASCRYSTVNMDCAESLSHRILICRSSYHTGEQSNHCREWPAIRDAKQIIKRLELHQ